MVNKTNPWIFSMNDGAGPLDAPVFSRTFNGRKGNLLTFLHLSEISGGIFEWKAIIELYKLAKLIKHSGRGVSYCH